MKKFINELNKKELTQVFNSNEKLRYNILDDMQESEMYWISEHLEHIKNSLSNWSIGANNHNFITVNDTKYYEFVEGVKKIQNDFCLLHDDENEFIEQLSNKINEYNNTDIYSDEFDKLEEEISQKVKQLAQKIADHYNSVFDYMLNTENQLRYFLEFYVHERLTEHCYIITSEKNYTLYEDISYTRDYAS